MGSLVRWILLGVVAAAGIALLTVAMPPDRPVDPKTPHGAQSAFTVGAILPLTGSAASVGEFQRNGLMTAARQINESGGVGGIPIDVVFGDSKNEGKTGLDVFQRMMAIDKPTVIIASHSGVCVPLASHMKATGRDDVVLFTTVSSAPGVPQMSGNVFRYFVTCENEAQTMARFAFNRLGLRRVAVFFINDDFGLGGYERFSAMSRSYGGDVVAADSYEKAGMDFRGSLTKLIAPDPEAAYVIGYAKAFAIAIRQLREVGYQGKVLTSIGMSVPAWRKLAGEAANGVFLTASLYDPDSQDSATREFVRIYGEQFGQDAGRPAVPNFQSAFLYDSLRMIARAAEQGGRTTAGTRDALSQVVDYHGVVGSAGFDAQGEADMPLRVMRVDGDRLVPAGD